MRDTSTLFKLCVKALLELSDEDKDVLIRLAYELMSDDARTPTNEHHPVAQELMRKGRTAHQQELDRQTKEVGKQAAARTRAKNKRKYKAKVKGQFDAATALAGHANKTHAPHGNEKTGPRGMSTQVLDILRQSTGALSPIEIAELLSLKPGRVSACLCDLFLRKKYKGLTRVAGKNDERAVYLYTLTEAK